MVLSAVDHSELNRDREAEIAAERRDGGGGGAEGEAEGEANKLPIGQGCDKLAGKKRERRK